MIYTNAKVCDDNFCLIDANIEIEGDKISRVNSNISGDSDREDLTGCLILPGLIDLHIHGCAGADTCDGTQEALQTMSVYLAAHGVTSFCPTTMTIPDSELRKVLGNVQDFVSKDPPGARVIGIHMEGPYISPEKSCAQKSEHIRCPDWNDFLELVEEYPGIIKIVDIAPEIPHAISFIEKACKICTVSMSHTAADYDTAMLSFERGISHVSHLFNAMTGIHHRNPGAAGAVLDDDKVMAELICDGIHLHPAMIRLACQILGEDRTILVSDAMRAAGQPDGCYDLGGQMIQVRDGRTYCDKVHIAGSTTDVFQEFRNLLRFGIPWKQAIKSATINPARQLGLDTEIGSIREGKYADFLVVDQNMSIRAVYIRGKKMAT